LFIYGAFFLLLTLIASNFIPYELVRMMKEAIMACFEGIF